MNPARVTNMFRRIVSTKKTILVATILIGVVALPQAAGAAPAAQWKTCERALHSELSHRPRRLKTVPPAALTAILGVLRRPAAPVDRLPAEALAGISPYAYSTLWLDSARLLDTAPGGKRYFLVPGVYTPPPLPEACVKLEQPHVRHQ